MLALDRPAASDRVRSVNQISQNRWNHQIVLRSPTDAQSSWLADLIRLAYAYGG